MTAGRYWIRLSRFLTIAANWSSGEVAQAVFHVGPDVLDTRPEPLPHPRDHGSVPATGPGLGLRRSQVLPSSSSKAIHAPVAAASLVPSPRSPSATP
jgi:hypothetical protein